MKHTHEISAIRSRRPLNIAAQLDLARHLAGCGARPVLEALHAVERGESVDAVLLDFGLLPAGCDRPRFPGAAEIIVAVASTDGRR
ncbi:MAG: hypothetical protein KK478_00160 [Ensifer alkalisoli]|nr:hypothetical protein [Sinorhizobium alkalisoli]